MLNEKLIGSIKLIASLRVDEKNDLYSLMNCHYDDVDQSQFLQDLADKHHIILFHDKESRQLRGFTTLKVLQLSADDNHICLFSGDTIIEKEYWGSVQLPRLWCVYINAMKEWFPGKVIYWLLLAKGYKTYRFMSVFFKNYYPHYDAVSSPLKYMLDRYAYAQCGDRYNRATHLIDGEKIKDRLKAGIADINSEDTKDPHVLFFLIKNPRWIHGSELASILEVSENNLTALGRRMFQQAYRKPEYIEPMPEQIALSEVYL